jgi:hypothetical protein
MNPYAASREIHELPQKKTRWLLLAICGLLVLTHLTFATGGYLVGYHDGYAWGNDDRVGSYPDGFKGPKSGKTILPPDVHP